MRALLDGLYRFCGILAGFFLVLIAVIILAQIASRELNFTLPSTDDFAGFAMAASAFLGLAPALRSGAHIRVTLLIGFLPPGPRRIAEFGCLITAIALLGYFSWYCVNMTWESYVFNDRSPGVLSFPLWIPQLAMTVGVVVLTIAFVDDLAAVLRGDVPSYDAATEIALESDRLGDSLATPGKERS